MSSTTSSDSIRKAIESFLAKRFEQKAGNLEESDPKREKLVQQFQREAWIADAAHRVQQIQLATHLIKAIHPSARGSSLFCPAEQLPELPYISSRHTGIAPARDVVGNAAALDVYKFLQLVVDERTLLDRLLANEPGLVEAFSDDPAKGAEWADAFRTITKSRGPASSHTLAKQLYFPLNDNGYHLLAPLYPSALIQRANREIRTHRFSEQAQAARKARRESAPSDNGTHDYPELAIQKLGGTKPQNISQLNSERYGENYLLPSLPPQWQSRNTSPLLGTQSAFYRFSRRPNVAQMLRGLARFLSDLPENFNNMPIRQHRATYVEAICDELLLFAAELQQLDSGWSADERCRLPSAQQYWLDPYRADEDREFRDARDDSDWPTTIAESFSNWLIQALERRQRRLKFDDDVYKNWRKELSKRMQQVAREIDNGF